MKTKFHFSLLRYVYDPLTQEFINIGVVLYSPEERFLRAEFTSRYGRVSRMFGRIDGASFRSTVNYVQRMISNASERINSGLLFSDPKEGLDAILGEVLPPDDTALRFAFGGVGLTENLHGTLETLFERYVARYESPAEYAHRDENDVWKVFQAPLRLKKVYTQLVPKKISAPNYEYEFERSWKNGVWHLFEPVSFDLLDERSILEKASRWLGRTVSLSDSRDPFKLFLLLGEPGDAKLRAAFQRAENLLAKIPVQRELVREREAEQFAEEIEQEFQGHSAESQE
ncbi:MAG: DUF3037 domain-containing protein [Terracidiphilus sp.]|jgi:hypothetical protein